MRGCGCGPPTQHRSHAPGCWGTAGQPELVGGVSRDDGRRQTQAHPTRSRRPHRPPLWWLGRFVTAAQPPQPCRPTPRAGHRRCQPGAWPLAPLAGQGWSARTDLERPGRSQVAAAPGRAPGRSAFGNPGRRTRADGPADLASTGWDSLPAGSKGQRDPMRWAGSCCQPRCGSGRPTAGPDHPQRLPAQGRWSL